MSAEPNLDKLLDKLQKIKAHAESAAAIGNEAEAQAFAEKLQKMLLQHDLELSDLDFERLDTTEPVEQHRVDVTDHGLPDKHIRTEWQLRLMSIVARANFCRILTYSGTSAFTLVGRKSHAAVAEYLIVTLVRAADRIATLAYGAYYRECQRAGDVKKARGFRDAFLASFVSRIYERLTTTRGTAASSSTALVRLNREDQAVELYMKGLHARKEIKKGRRLVKRDPRALHAVGWVRGRAAADQVQLDSKAVTTSATPRKALR